MYSGEETLSLSVLSSFQMGVTINPIALKRAKIVYNFGLSECNRVKGKNLLF